MDWLLINRRRRRQGGSNAHPLAYLFAAGEDGYILDPSAGSMFTDSGATTAAAASDPVWWLYDVSGNGHHVSAPTSAARPTLTESGGLKWLQFDGVNSLMERLNSTLVLKGPHTHIVAMDRGTTNSNYQLGGVRGTANVNDYSLMQGQISDRALATTRFNSNAVSAIFTTATAGNFPVSTPSVLTREVELSPGNLSLRVNGGSVSTNTTASNWTASEETAADTRIIFGPNAAATSVDLKMYFDLFIDRALTSTERAAVEDYARQTAGIAAW